MDRERLRLSHMQSGTYYVQICDQWIYRPTNMYRPRTSPLVHIYFYLYKSRKGGSCTCL